MAMASFGMILAEIKRDCGWEHIPYDKVSALAKVSGLAEVEHLISELSGDPAAGLCR
jgi:hypothetical protein